MERARSRRKEHRHTARNLAALTMGATFVLAACMSQQEPYREPIDYEFGITIDRVNAIDETVRVIDALPYQVTTRIVYDEFVEASEYVGETRKIASVSKVMGEILDSLYVPEYDTEQYAARTEEYVDTLGEYVDIWEIGNEANGEWLLNEGEHPSVVADKVQAAFNVVAQRGGQTALTLVYNENCYEQGQHEIFTWIDENLPRDMLYKLDYLLISYYEEDCDGRIPIWQPVFERLHTIFPNSKLGFGEVGMRDGTRADKIETAERYYGYGIDVGGEASDVYIGGVFWWYFWEDVVEPAMRGDEEMLNVFKTLRQ